mmetsp:Transcript_4886/g.11582  ORF Transcript_4886/g.11582 Transcript_4886/m.11582 type:complete len:253 (+) Transcript_4886:1213-1971(+)
MIEEGRISIVLEKGIDTFDMCILDSKEECCVPVMISPVDLSACCNQRFDATCLSPHGGIKKRRVTALVLHVDLSTHDVHLRDAVSVSMCGSAHDGGGSCVGLNVEIRSCCIQLLDTLEMSVGCSHHDSSMTVFCLVIHVDADSNAIDPLEVDLTNRTKVLVHMAIEGREVLKAEGIFISLQAPQALGVAVPEKSLHFPSRHMFSVREVLCPHSPCPLCREARRLEPNSYHPSCLHLLHLIQTLHRASRNLHL